MSLEDDFRKLIIEQNAEEKELFWQKFEKRRLENAEEEVVELGEVLAKRRALSKRNIILIAVACFLVVAVTVILIIKFFPTNPTKIYSAANDCYSISTETTIADYASENNLSLLYFTWYNESDFVTDQQYRLNNTDKVICLSETLISKEDLYITIYITKANVEIDMLDKYSNICSSTKKVSTVDVEYGLDSFNAYAKFTYNNYKYYVEVEDGDADYLTLILSDLIK